MDEDFEEDQTQNSENVLHVIPHFGILRLYIHHVPVYVANTLSLIRLRAQCSLRVLCYVSCTGC